MPLLEMRDIVKEFPGVRAFGGLGSLIAATLDNGMSLLSVRDFMHDMIKESILGSAVGLDMMGWRRT